MTWLTVASLVRIIGDCLHTVACVLKLTAIPNVHLDCKINRKLYKIRFLFNTQATKQSESCHCTDCVQWQDRSRHLATSSYHQLLLLLRSWQNCWKVEPGIRVGITDIDKRDQKSSGNSCEWAGLDKVVAPGPGEPKCSPAYTAYLRYLPTSANISSSMAVIIGQKRPV